MSLSRPMFFGISTEFLMFWLATMTKVWLYLKPVRINSSSVNAVKLRDSLLFNFIQSHGFDRSVFEFVSCEEVFA